MKYYFMRLAGYGENKISYIAATFLKDTLAEFIKWRRVP